jgi:hypothetical protein
MSDDDKLRVPDPAGPEETDDAGEALALVGVVCILLSLAFFLFQYRSYHQKSEAGRAEGGAATRQTDAGAPDAGADLQQIVDRLERRRRDERGLPDHDWTSLELVATFQVGYRGLAESACRAVSGELADGTLADGPSAALRESVIRRNPRAPWTCLFERYFADRDSLPDPVVRSLGAVWEHVRQFNGHRRLFATVLDGFRLRESTPEDPDFRRWLRLCGLNFAAGPGTECRRLLAELAPSEGADLLGVVEAHLRRVESLNPSYDLPVLVDGLGSLARSGQPADWRIDETDELPDYDLDLRLGAIFYLCRFVNTPNDAVANRAARQLSRAAEVGVRAVDKTLVPRWRRACRLAFGTEDEEAETWRAPALGVWNGEPDAPPHYDVASAIERGDCRRRDGHPFWYCGALKWNAGRPAQLVDFFVETRSAEWTDEAVLTPGEPTR